MAQMSPSALRTLADVKGSFGNFVSAEQLATLASDPITRLTPVLVRCGGFRFVAPAQDAKRLIEIIEAERSDYIRDVSLPAAGRV